MVRKLCLVLVLVFGLVGSVFAGTWNNTNGPGITQMVIIYGAILGTGLTDILHQALMRSL
jgi:hypothetical protein